MMKRARDTKHEKISRGFSVGMALVLYGARDNAEGWLAQMVSEKVGKECSLCPPLSSCSSRCDGVAELW